MTFLGEIIELHLQQGNFLEYSCLLYTNKRKVKIDVSSYFYSSPRGVFMTLPNI